MVASLIAGIKLRSWVYRYEEEEKQSARAASEGEAHPVKVKTLPVTPKEALSLQSTDVTRIEYLVGWVNGHLCKLNNENQRTDLSFLYKNENRKTIDAICDLFREHGWNVKEHSRSYEGITFKFETTEKVRVKLDDVVGGSHKEAVQEVEEIDELEQKFVDLEKKMATKK